MRALYASLAFVSLVAGCSGGTYVVVDLSRGASAPAGIMSVELDLALDGQTASRTLTEPRGGAVQFPTSAVFTVDKSAGELTIVAIGHDAAGHELVRAAGTGNVVRGRSTAISLSLGQPAPDGGAGSGTLALDPGMHDFGSAVTSAGGSSFTFTLGNNGAMASGKLSASIVGNDRASFALAKDQCTGATVAPSASCAVTVTFKPTANGGKSATLLLSDGENLATAALTGVGLAGGTLAIAPSSSNDFGQAVLNSPTAPFRFTISNGGSAATGPLAVTVTGNDPGDFTISGDGCSNMKLGPQASCTIDVGFTPLASGARSATLQIVGSPGGAVTASLAGEGVTAAGLAFTQNANYAFGPVDIGHSQSVTLTVGNTGTQATGAIATTLSGDTGDFQVSDNCNATMLPGSGTCTITVAAAPANHGDKSLTIALAGTPGGSVSTTITAGGRDALLLTVVPGGNGSGTVSAAGGGTISAGSGIACGVTCSDSYYRTGANPMVTLQATPATGSSVSGWSVAGCGTADSCAVTLSAATQVSVTFTKLKYTLTVSTTSLAGQTGSVASTSPTGISCPGTCSLQVDYGTTVALGETPAQGAYFGGWSGGCTGFAPTCSVAVTGPTNVSATFTKANVIFTTSTQYSWNGLAALGTGSANDAKIVSGADQACANAAAAGSLPGHFVAFISGSAPAATRLASSPSGNTSPRGWIRPDGKPVLETLPPSGTRMVTYYPPSLSEKGSVLPATRAGITGSTGSGSVASQFDCVDWTSTSSSNGVNVGEVLGPMDDWIDDSSVSCNGGSNVDFSVYCLQTDYSAYVPPPLPPASRRRIFVSSKEWQPSTGIAAADTMCGSLAAAQGLPGTYKALLPTTSASAASRFTAHGLPVVRPDGVIVAATDTAMFAAGFTPAAMPYQNELGGELPENVWTGGENDLSVVASSTDRTCNNWSSASGTGIMGQGDRPFTWLVGYSEPCANTHAVYCLQE